MIAAIALDLGTTSIKAALMDPCGNLSSIVSRPAPVINGQQGRYESDALQYAESVDAVLAQCLAGTPSKPPLGLCSQRSSFLIWDTTSGQPVTPLISWQDDRGANCCDRLHASAGTIQSLTGLRLTPYYFAPKLNVLLQQNPLWRKKLIESEWRVGTLDTFLIWRWTNQQHFITDVSMAARTLLMDIHQLQWSEDLCRLFDVPRSVLPEIQPSTGFNLPLSNRLTLQASVGDQSAALFASLADNRSEALVNLGTGGFVIRSLKSGESAFNGYLQTLVCQTDQPAHFAIEGTLNSIAAALAPYPVKSCTLQELAISDIYCLAEPSGLGAPYFRSDWGLYFSQAITHLNQQQVASLLLEAIIFRVTRIVEEFHRHAPLSAVLLSGGLSELPCLQQGIAQCSSVPVFLLQQKEASLQGAAILAAGLTVINRTARKKIMVEQANSKLNEKYLHWKQWLNVLLKIPRS
ncbi:MAG: carbohydrate kinase [Proteobacteria bacterium SG_bin4]|nr:MAG: carbohydrate kinase [Proteobacteria bacterium SG_bin4]